MLECIGSSDLLIYRTPGSQVLQVDEGTWRLIIPAGEGKSYTCAQIDDYHNLNRKKFPHKMGTHLYLEARVSARNIPGTWGFGFWNDPFQMNLGIKGSSRRFPALPDAVWYFYAGEPNYLAFRDNHPATGMLAAVFRSPRLPIWLLVGTVIFFPLLAIPGTAKMIRKIISRIIQEDAHQLDHDPTMWNQYELFWGSEKVECLVNEKLLWSSTLVPNGSLGLVIWIDNQYAAFPPDGRIKMGVLPSKTSNWMEIRNIRID